VSDLLRKGVLCGTGFVTMDDYDVQHQRRREGFVI